jgi:hypothetical protein
MRPTSNGGKMPPKKQPRTWTEISLDWAERNVALLDQPWKLAAVWATRLLVLLGLVFGLKLLWTWDGRFPTAFDMPFAVSLFLAFFSILLSWAFFHSAQTASDATTRQLLLFLKDMREESRSNFGQLSKIHGLPDQVTESAQRVMESPEDMEVKFEFYDRFVEEADKQLLVLIANEKGFIRDELPYNYKLATEHTFSNGWSNTSHLKKSFTGTGLIDFPRPDEIRLTAYGRRFVDWLKTEGRVAKVFKSNLGGWGEANDIPEPFRREFDQQANLFGGVPPTASAANPPA